jgi:type 1 glutamine amidotransferase
MNNSKFQMKKLFLLLAAVMTATYLQAEPKKLLVVTTTTGFRHSSIPTGEKILAQLAKDSGEFTVDFVEQPPGHPETGFPTKLKPDASEADKAAFATAEAAWNEKLQVALQKLSPENLSNYDGVVFLSTTGDLPIPDKQGFLDWIKAGHAFIGIHAAADTFHGWPGYIDMLGGEFAHHGPQVSVACINVDPSNPATAHLSKAWMIQQEEIYQFKNYDPAKVHELLILEKHPETGVPGHYGVCWCKDYGAGRVFYTSLGHREDIWDADPGMKDRKNSVEISKAYQAHILGGIEWALGLKRTVPAK